MGSQSGCVRYDASTNPRAFYSTGLGCHTANAIQTKTYAALSAIASPTNGDMYYCSDCAAATPCAGSGTGAFAQRAAGTWKCSAGGGGTECSTSSCDLNVSTTLNSQGICLANGTNCPAAPSAAFSAITNGTNTTAAMVVGSGASLGTSGSGTITATNTNCTGCIDATDLASTAVTPGSCTLCSLTVDADGRITAQSSGTSSGITTLTPQSGGATTGTNIGIQGDGSTITTAQSSPDVITITLDTTLINDKTFGNNADSPMTWTWNPTGTTNPTLDVQNGSFTWTGHSIWQNVSNNGAQVDATGVLKAYGGGSVQADDLQCGTSCVSDAEITSITTRAKLPSALAYEDEANTFASAGSQTFNDPVNITENLDVNLSGTVRLLVDSATGVTMSDNLGLNGVYYDYGTKVFKKLGTGRIDADNLNGTNFNTMTDGKACVYASAGTEVNCNATFLTAESDPKVGTVTSGNFCKGTGTQVSCTDSSTYLTAESDPQVGTLTNTKWCTTDGSAVNCTSNAPVLTEVDPQVGTVTGTNFCHGDGSGNVACTDASTYLTSEVDGSTTNELPLAGNYITISGSPAQTVAMTPSKVGSATDGGSITWGDNTQSPIDWIWNVSGTTDPYIEIITGNVTFFNATVGSRANDPAFNLVDSSPVKTAGQFSGSCTDTSNCAVAITYEDSGLKNLITADGATSAATIGSASLDSLTVTTNGTGDAEVVLPTSSIGSSEVAGLDISDDTNLAATSPIVLTNDTLSCANAVADGTTKGCAGFNATRFSATAGVIDIASVAGITGADADNVSLADVQSATSNDFHNIGGTDDDVPESGDFTNLTGGAGITNTAGTLATASDEQNFLKSGALTCGAATNGKMQVHTSPLQYCDNAATPTLQYAAYGDSSGNALTGDSATAFFGAGTLEVNRGGTGTSSTLTGFVRGNASAMTATELSGDVSTSGSGVTSIGADKVTAAMLAFNYAAGDAEAGGATKVTGSITLPATCTEGQVYQDTDSGGTEFYICTATNTWTKTIAASDVSFTVAGTSGSNQTINNGDTFTIAAGTGITTAGAATDKVTIASTLGTAIDTTEITDNTITNADIALGLTSGSVCYADSNGDPITDSNFLWDATNKRLGLNNTGSTLTPGTVIDILNEAGTADRSQIRMTRYINSAGTAGGVIRRRGRGTAASPTKILSGDALGSDQWHGYYDDGAGGTGFVTTATVAVNATEDYVTTGGSKITMSSTPTGGTLTTTLTAFGGKVGVGPNAATPTARLDVVEDTVNNSVLSLKSIATNDDPTYQVYQARVQTTGAGASTLYSFAPTSGQVYLIEVHTLARCVSGANCTAGDVQACVVYDTVKNIGGTVTEGTQTSAYTQTDASMSGSCNAAADLAVSGSNFVIGVTGAASETVTWHSTIMIQNLGS